jgi:membrane protease YdiL (CAAX protease family)
MNYLENILDTDNSFWKYIVVCVVTFIAMQLIGAIIIIIAIAAYLFSYKGAIDMEVFSNLNNLYDTGLSENFILVLMFIPFVVGIITIWLLVEKMHKRTFSMTVNGRRSIRWEHIFTGFLFWFLLMFVFCEINYIADPNNFVLQFDVCKFIPLLIIVLLFIPFQVTFEEFVFRGYLAQGIAAWTKNRWLVICIPGLLFGLAHYQNNEVVENGFWATMPQYIILGLFFGLLAVLDDGIELSIGIHAANNIFACLCITNSSSSLRTSAIFNQRTVNPVSETIALLVAISLATLFFYKKYKWNFHILNEKVKHKELEYES